MQNIFVSIQVRHPHVDDFMPHRVPVARDRDVGSLASFETRIKIRYSTSWVDGSKSEILFERIFAC